MIDDPDAVDMISDEEQPAEDNWLDEPEDIVSPDATLGEPLPLDEMDEEEPEEGMSQQEADEFLQLARRAHEQSESFIEASQMRRWRRNFSVAQSEHPDGSKYLSEAYANRARHFRGKTEASIRKNEAALAVAMFSNHDVVSISQEFSTNVEVSETLHQMTNHHLDKSIKWFMIAIGAYHEAMIAGDLASEAYWHYERDEEGTILIDRPSIDLIPLENIKISPNANWLDPINSSPYVVVEVPMFIYDIKERMKVDWIEYPDTQIQASCSKFRQNDMKQARQGREQASAEDAAKSTVTDFDFVYVHKNAIRKDGVDWFYYTLGKELLLSVPVPIQEAYPHLKNGQRPWSWGTVTIEPHKVYRRSMVDRIFSSQALANEIGNLRVDNVRQVLNKRKFVQRFMGVDYAALKSSVPGGIVMMDDINAVRPEETIDVTGSSYQEQAVINADFDELAGTFSSSSVQTNRQLNETVGGMELLKGDANTLTEYQLRVFVETWVEPTLKTIVEMIAYYDDDATLQRVTGNQQVTSDMLQQPVEVRADVGFGSTDPNAKVQKLVMGTKTAMQLPQAAAKMAQVTIAREIFSILGFNDGKKYIPDGEEQEDPRIQQMMAEIQNLQQIIATDQVKAQSAMNVEMQRGKNSLAEAVIRTQTDRQIKLTQMALDRGIKLKDLEAKAGIDSGKLNLDYLKEINRRMDIANQQKELSFKMQTGQEGI